MNTLAILGIVLAIVAVLSAYQLGYSAGKREGFADGQQATNKEATMRAFAVGYDRGKRAKEAEAPPPDPPAPRGCTMILASLLIAMAGTIAWISSVIAK